MIGGCRFTKITPMRRSLNEFSSTVAKAAVAAGYPQAPATELADAAILLYAHGYDGLTAVLAALNGGMPAPPRPEGNDLWFKDGNAAVSGLAAAEVVLVTGGCARFAALESPILLLGLVALAATHYAAAYHLVFSSGGNADELSIPAGDYLLAENRRMPPPGCEAVLTRLQSAAAVPAIAWPEGISVDEARWQTVADLAAQTYVVANDESRSADAGAGEIDND